MSNTTLAIFITCEEPSYPLGSLYLLATRVHHCPHCPHECPQVQVQVHLHLELCQTELCQSEMDEKRQMQRVPLYSAVVGGFALQLPPPSLDLQHCDVATGLTKRSKEGEF